MTKILVLADTHYRSGMPDDSIMKLASGYDHMIHAGDYMNDDAEEEMESSCNFYGVAGNNDPWNLHNRLGRKKIIIIDGVKIGICHGDGMWMSPFEASRQMFKGTDADVVIFGHSHMPHISFEGKTLYLNPGSFAAPRGGSARSYAVLTLNNGNAEAEIVKR